jgi:transposase
VAHDVRKALREVRPMRGRVIEVEWRESAERLGELYRGEKQAERRTRLQALWLLRRGKRLEEVAALTGVGYRTLQRWLAWYRAGGLGEVLRRVRGHGSPGRAPRLSPAQRAALVARAGAGRFRTYHEARAWVQREYGVHYTYQGMYAALARLGVRPKVPRPAAAQADPAAQAAWQRGGSPRP